MDLNPSEQVVFRGHPSWRSILSLYAKWLAVTVLLAGLSAAATEVFADEIDIAVVALIGLGGLTLTLLVGFLRRMSTTYTITNRRLRIRRGLVSREIQETRLERIGDITRSQSLIERILGVGTVEFDTTAGGDDYEFRFVGVADPTAVIEAANHARNEPK